VVFICRASANVGMVLSKSRLSIGDIEASL
jgi:hypothetical protein